MHRSKLYRAQIEKFDRQQLYDLDKSLEILKDMPHTGFPN